MTVPVVLTIAGFVAILLGILGGGVKAKEVEIPPISPLGRGIIILVGLTFLGLGLWLSFPNAASSQKATPTATTAPPTLTSTLLPSLAATSTATLTPSQTSTPTATLTPLPTDTPLPKPLVEIFPQVGGGEVFTFTNEGGTLSGKYVTTTSCIHSGVYGLQIAFDMKGPGNGGWGVLWDNAPAGHFNASDFGTLTFWVRGTSGREIFQVGLKDTVGNEAKIESEKVLIVSSSWMQVAIPLGEFTGVNPGLIENINFGFNKDHRTGSICIDDISFTP